MRNLYSEHLAGLIFAPATLVLTMGVFADLYLTRKKDQTKRDDECCEECMSDPLFITSWLNLLFSGTYALLATIYYYVAFGTNDLCGLFAASGGVFMVSRLALYLHFIVRNHIEDHTSNTDISWFRRISCGTAVVTTAVAVIRAWVTSTSSCQLGGVKEVLLVCLDVIYTSYIMYLVWGLVSDIRSPRRISHDSKYVMVRHIVVFSTAVLTSWITLIIIAVVFPPIGLLGAAFNSVYVGLLFKGNEEEYEKWCCCHFYVWEWGKATALSPRIVTSGTSGKSRSSQEGMMTVEMTTGGEGASTGNAETKKEEQYVE